MSVGICWGQCELTADELVQTWEAFVHRGKREARTGERKGGVKILKGRRQKAVYRITLRQKALQWLIDQSASRKSPKSDDYGSNK